MIRETTPSLYAIKLLDVMTQQGFARQPLVRRFGFTAGELSAPDRHIPIEKYLALVSHCVEQADLEDLGFRVGEHTELLEHGALGYALISSRTLEESLHRYIRLQRVLGPLLEISLESHDDTAVMVAQPVAIAEDLPQQVVHYFLQEWLATWNHWCRLIRRSGGFFSLVRINLTEPAHAHIYREHLLCDVVIAEGPTQENLPADSLLLPIQYSDVRTGAFCHEQCELLLQAISSQHGLTAEIHRQLAHTPGQVPGMEEVAERIGMTGRTLRRHLLAEGETFQDIVIAHRIGLAKRYLAETSIPTEDIAALVGYSDPANFYRMFRLREGTTPARYRTGVS